MRLSVLAAVGIAGLVFSSFEAEAQIDTAMNWLRELVKKGATQAQLPEAVEKLVEVQEAQQRRLADLEGRLQSLSTRLTDLRRSYQQDISDIALNKAAGTDVDANRRTIGNLEDRVADVERGLEGTESTLAPRAVPPGAVVPFRLADCPRGWTKFDEASGRMIVGVGHGAGLTNRTLDEFGGDETHKLSIDEIPSHDHNVLKSDTNRILYFTNKEEKDFSLSGDDYELTTSLNARTDATGGDEAFDIMPPFYTLLYCKKD